MQACKWQVAKQEGLSALSPFPVLSALCLAQGVEPCRLSPGLWGPHRSLLHTGSCPTDFPDLFQAEASSLCGSQAALHPATHARWPWTCISQMCVCMCVAGFNHFADLQKKISECLGSVLSLACGLGHLSPVWEQQQNLSQMSLP